MEFTSEQENNVLKAKVQLYAQRLATAHDQLVNCEISISSHLERIKELEKELDDLKNNK